MDGELLVVDAGPIETEVREHPLNATAFLRDLLAHSNLTAAQLLGRHRHAPRAMLGTQSKSAALAESSRPGNLGGAVS